MTTQLIGRAENCLEPHKFLVIEFPRRHATHDPLVRWERPAGRNKKKENHMKIRNVAQVLGIVVIGIALVSCASIIHGTSQQVGIGSTPSGAKITVSGKFFGTTPTIGYLKRSDNHIVKIELDGYLPYETTLTKRVSGWVWGNILFGGFIGLAVDAISGGLYNLLPEQIQAVLSKEENAHLQLTDDAIYFFVTLAPDPSWTKVGQMTKAN